MHFDVRIQVAVHKWIADRIRVVDHIRVVVEICVFIPSVSFSN